MKNNPSHIFTVNYLNKITNIESALNDLKEMGAKAAQYEQDQNGEVNNGTAERMEAISQMQVLLEEYIHVLS